MEDFHKWLIQKYSERTTHSRMSNCRRIEKFEGSLDEHYFRDEGKSLLGRLSYSSEDERKKKQAKHKVPINGNIRNGTATLKQAAMLYIQYKSETSKLTEKPEIDSSIQTPEINFFETAKRLAKNVAGEDEKFTEFINGVPIDQNFDRIIKKKLTEMLDTGDNNLTLYELINQAYTTGILTKEVKYFADTIRIYRNLNEYDNIDPNLEKCLNLIVLFAFSGIWRYFNGN